MFEKEVALFPKWLLWHGLTAPQALGIARCGGQAIGRGRHIVCVSSLKTQAGWLPTYIAEKSIGKENRPRRDCGAGPSHGRQPQTGKAREDIGRSKGVPTKVRR